MASLLLISCAKKKNDEIPKKNSTFSIKLENLENGHNAFLSGKATNLFNKAKSGELIDVVEALEILNNNYQNFMPLPHENLAKTKIFNLVRSSLPNLENLTAVKSTLFDTYQKEMGNIFYNANAINIYNIDQKAKAKFQCSSGTWNIWNAYLSLDATLINKKKLVNIYTYGHMLPGEIIAENGHDVLYGYESTVLGEGKVPFGPISELDAPIRIVDLKYDIVLHALNTYLSGTDKLRKEVLQKTADLYHINLIHLEAAIVRTQRRAQFQTAGQYHEITDDEVLNNTKELFNIDLKYISGFSEITIINQMNQSVFAFGDADAPECRFPFEVTTFRGFIPTQSYRLPRI